MAAVTTVAPSLVSPTGEARIRRGQATEDVAVGQALAIDGSPSSARFETALGLAADEESAVGLALKNAKEGEIVDVLIEGEMGGFSGLTPGALLSVSGGDLDDTAPAGATRFLAWNATTVMVIGGLATPPAGGG